MTYSKSFLPAVGGRLAGLAGMTCLAAVLSAGAATAQTCTEDPETYIDRLGGQVVEIVSVSDGRDERKLALRDMFDEHVEIDTVARVLLGRYRRGLDDIQSDAYFQAIPGYISNLYAGQLSLLEGDDVVIEGSRQSGEADTLVQAAFTMPGGPDLGAQFRVRCVEGTQKLLDASVQGISLVITKRDEFSAYLRSNSIEDLIVILEEQQ